MTDVLIITQCPRIVKTFLTVEPKCLEGTRIWVFVDNRNKSTNIVPFARDKAKQFKVRPSGDMDLIQAAIDSAIEECNPPVFPHAINGEKLVKHYDDLWNLNSIQRDFRRWHMSSVRFSALSVMKDFYGVDKILALDDDTALFQNPKDMVDRHDNAMNNGGVCAKINKGPYDPEVFGMIADCIGHKISIEEYDELPLSWGAIVASNMDNYTQVFKDFYSHPTIAETFLRLQSESRKPSGVLRTIDQVVCGVYQKMVNGTIFKSTEIRFQGSRKQNGRADYPKTVRSLPVVFHYCDTQLMKWMSAEWVASLIRAKFSSGAEYYQTPIWWYDLPNYPLKETIDLYNGNLDWLKPTLDKLP